MKHYFTIVTYCHDTDSPGVVAVKAKDVEEAIRRWPSTKCCTVCAVFEGHHTPCDIPDSADASDAFLTEKE